MRPAQTLTHGELTALDARRRRAEREARRARQRAIDAARRDCHRDLGRCDHPEPLEDWR